MLSMLSSSNRIIVKDKEVHLSSFCIKYYNTDENEKWRFSKKEYKTLLILHFWLFWLFLFLKNDMKPRYGDRVDEMNDKD